MVARYACDPRVEVLSLARQDCRVHGLRQQRVPELHGVAVRPGDQDPAFHGLPQGLAYDRLRRTGRLVQRGGGHGPPHYGS